MRFTPHVFINKNKYMKKLMYVLIAAGIGMAVYNASLVNRDGAILCMVCIAVAICASLALVADIHKPDEYDFLTR